MLEGVGGGGRIGEWGEAVVEKLEDAGALLRVELAEFAVELSGEFNLPGHGASKHLPVEWSALPRCECEPECARPDTGPQDRRGAQSAPRGHKRSWCGRCDELVFPGVFRWILGGEPQA